MIDICKLVENYAPKKLKSSTIIAGFDDHRSSANVIRECMGVLNESYFGKVQT